MLQFYLLRIFLACSRTVWVAWCETKDLVMLKMLKQCTAFFFQKNINFSHILLSRTKPAPSKVLVCLVLKTMLFQLRLSNRKRTVRLFGLRNPPPPLSETSSVKQSLGKKNRDLDESVN